MAGIQYALKHISLLSRIKKCVLPSLIFVYLVINYLSVQVKMSILWIADMSQIII